jgi:hypothetical protein
LPKLNILHLGSARPVRIRQLWSRARQLGLRASVGKACVRLRSWTLTALKTPVALVLGSLGARRFRTSGYHPFVAVWHGRDFVVCNTQNDAPEFVHQVQRLPDYARSRLLRGIERALQLETYEAAGLFFAWTKDEAGAPEEGIVLPFLEGYPEFELAPKRPPAGPAAKVSLLIDTFQVYRRAPGNDALRFALLEALAFGLSRSLGALGRYAEAARVVASALEVVPYSIHLKAARHALELKTQGAPVPDRLAKFIGEDNGSLKKFVCAQPFTRFDIGPAGEVLLCCGHWLPTPIGNFVSSPVESILNSPAAQKIRRSVTDGTYAYCNHLECAPMAQGALPLRESLPSGPLQKAVDPQDYEVQEIHEILFALDRTCNLSCPSCRRERITEKFSESDDIAASLANKLLPLLRGVRVLNINPAGELFVSKLSRRILDFINDENTPDLVLDIISNGVLFNEKEWSRFPGIHRRIRSVRISTDAATPATFETLRRGGQWEPFLENLRFLQRLRRSGVVPQLKLSFTYQRDNFREMRDFVALCESLSADFVIFERLQNLGAYTHQEYLDRAVHRPEHPLHAEFVAVARDPIFRTKRVWHDFEFPGVEKLSPEDARARLIEPLPALDSGQGS